MTDKTNYQKGYCLGFHEAKVACIHAIAIQYSEHGELVPNLLARVAFAHRHLIYISRLGMYVNVGMILGKHMALVLLQLMKEQENGAHKNSTAEQITA